MKSRNAALAFSSSSSGAITTCAPSQWQCETEQRALSGHRFHPDAAAIPLDDALANRQADAGSRVGISMQALENAEDLLGIFRLDPDAVVAHGEQPVYGPAFCSDVNLGWIRTAILDSVANQVLQELHELDFM